MTTPFTTFAFPATGAPTSRTMPSRLLDFVNVKDFGAVGNGVTDNTAAFAAALAAATTGAKTGGIYVPRGTYALANGSNIPLPPGTSYGTGGPTSFAIRGESAGSTIIAGNVNGFILDNSGSTTAAGSHTIENLQVINSNTTPYTSGCIRLCNGQGIYVRSCIGEGQVFLTTEYTPGLRKAQIGGVIEACQLSSGQAGNSIAIVANSDFLNIIGCGFNAWGYGVVGANSLNISGSHFETCGVGFLGGATGNALSSSVLGIQMDHCTFEACGTAIDIIGPTTGSMSNIGIQCHGPVYGGDGGDAHYGMRLRDGKFRLLDLRNVLITGAVDQVMMVIGTCGGNSIRPNNRFQGLDVGSIYGSTPYSLPGSATGGSAARGEAAVGKFEQCNISPIWKFADLPYETLHTAAINGTTLTYGSTGGNMSPPAILGGLITGAGVTAGSRVTANGTTFLGGTIDNGSGASGSVLNFTSYTGVAPAAGTIINGNSQTVLFNGGISNGSGGAGHILTLTPCTITSASISGTTLTFSLVNASNFPGTSSGLAGTKVTGAGVSANTFVVSGSGTTWTVNKTHAVGPITLTFVPDLRPGMTMIEDTGSGATVGWVISSAGPGANQWTMTGESDQLVTASMSGNVWLQTLATNTTLTTQNSATSWNVNTAQNQAYVGGGEFVAANTWEVSKSQTVGSEDMTSYCCLTGDEFTIGDSPTASASNFGTAVTTGGSTHTVKLRMDGETGFIIV